MSRVLDTQNSINDRIASETKTLHERNNKIASLKMVLALRSSDYWREYLRSFYWLFKTFEEEVAQVRSGGPGHLRDAFEAVHEPLLTRTKRIEQDLMFYYDNDKSVLDHAQTSKEREYVRHVKMIAQTDPVRLLAYLSVMYLGLFAGGQIIKSKMIKRTGFYPAKAGLTHAQVMERGTNIFNFDTDDTTKLKKVHRARFDRVCLEHLSEDERDKVVDEAKLIFMKNEQLIACVQVPGTAALVLQTFKTPLMILLIMTLCFLAYLQR